MVGEGDYEGRILERLQTLEMHKIGQVRFYNVYFHLTLLILFTESKTCIRYGDNITGQCLFLYS